MGDGDKTMKSGVSLVLLFSSDVTEHCAVSIVKLINIILKEKKKR